VQLAVPGKDVFASDSDGDLYAAIDKVRAKLARRLRKRKTRLLNGREKWARTTARRRDEDALTEAFAQTKILLVDDDSSVLAALTGVLQSEGYDVRHAFNGHDALGVFHTLPDISLVLLDLNMPVKGGWDTFERLTAINPLLPIIIITARPDQYTLAAAAGVAALMEKPLDIPLLLETMQQLLTEPPELRLARIAGKHPHTLFLEAPAH
jgi:CheY-like chemotaxis protein